MRAGAIAEDRTLQPTTMEERALSPARPAWRSRSGDRVTVYPFASCGECPNCLRGDLHVCVNAAFTGLGLGKNPGGYAESVVVLIAKEAQMRAAFAYTRKDFDDAVRLLAAGNLPADKLITGTAPLERAQEMFERLESPATRDVKILLSPGT